MSSAHWLPFVLMTRKVYVRDLVIDSFFPLRPRVSTQAVPCSSTWVISCDIGQTFENVSKTDRILELAFTSASAAFICLDKNSTILLGFFQ